MESWISSNLDLPSYDEGHATTISSPSSSPTYENAAGVKVNAKKATSLVNKRNKNHHNKVEQKYRANLIEKFVDLRNAVPTLRAASPNSNVSATELEGLLPAAKVNKATILTKAIEYIKYLESKNAILMNTVQSLNQNCSTALVQDPAYQQQQQQQQPFADTALPPVQPQYSEKSQRAYSDISGTQSSYTGTSDQVPYSNSFSTADTVVEAAPVAYSSLDYNASYAPAQQDPLPGYQELHQHQYVQHQHDDTHFEPYIQEQLSQQRHATQFAHPQTASDAGEIYYSNSNSNQNPPPTVYAQAYPDRNNSNIQTKLMAGTLACFAGAEFIDSQYDYNYKGYSALPIDPSCIKCAIGFLKWVSILICGFSMLYPYFQPKKATVSDTDANSLTTTPASFIINLTLGSLTTKDPRAKDITKFPTSTIGRFIYYIKLNNVAQDSEYLVEVEYIKLLILGLTITKFPMFSYLTKLGIRKHRIKNKLLMLTKNKHSKLGDYIKTFNSRKSTYAELDAILLSLSQHKSSKEVIVDVFGNNLGYNSVAEYLEMTPIRSMNLFELFSLIGVLNVIKLNFVQYLSDSFVNNYSIPDDKLRNLLREIDNAENYIPTTCFKLIKCCNLFKCLLDPTNKAYLDDALKTILSCIEQNMADDHQKDIKDEDIKPQLLQVIRNPTLNIVEKIVSFLQIAKASNIPSQYLCDDNRLSLVCTLILHYSSVGMVDKTTGLIQFLKRDKSKKFASDNSVSLVSLIATYKALFVILNRQSENSAENVNLITEYDFDLETCSKVSSISDISNFEISSSSKAHLSFKDKAILEDLISGIRLYLGHNGDTEGTIDGDILNLHYGLKSELSHKLLHLAKDLVGYNST